MTGSNGSGTVPCLTAMNGCSAAIAAVRTPLINGRVRPEAAVQRNCRQRTFDGSVISERSTGRHCGRPESTIAMSGRSPIFDLVLQLLSSRKYRRRMEHERMTARVVDCAAQQVALLQCARAASLLAATVALPSRCV